MQRGVSHSRSFPIMNFPPFHNNKQNNKMSLMKGWYSFEFYLCATRRNVNLCIDPEAIISQNVWNKNEWVKCNIVNSLCLYCWRCIQNIFEAVGIWKIIDMVGQRNLHIAYFVRTLNSNFKLYHSFIRIKPQKVTRILNSEKY